MKKLLLLLVCLFTFQAVVKANDDKPIKVAQCHNRLNSLLNRIW